VVFTKAFWQKNKLTLAYGLCLAGLLFLLKWLELRLLIFNHAFEIYIGAIAILFTALGIWLATKLATPKTKTVVVVKEVLVQQEKKFVLNPTMVEQIGITKRELEILQMLSLGFSNQKIADKLFISLSTVKAHNQNLFEKLEVKNRTEAVAAARRLMLLP